jgi:streptogramin lyase
MSPAGRRSRALLTAALALATPGAAAHAQAVVQPTNALPNPYQTVTGWAKLHEGRTWGSTSAVEIDRDGVSIWVAERCGANNCAGSALDPILQFDSTGKLVKSFGAGLLISPHGIFVDRDDNIWVTDCTCTGGTGGRVPGADSIHGHQVFKFSPQGKLLMTLGTAGGAKEPGYFFQPNDVLVAPNGDVYVAEGHSSAPGAAARILKFSQDGKLIATLGKRGTGPGEFDQPHALAMDSKGRLFVGDRGNNRLQVLDQNGTFLAEWKQFSRPSGLYIDHDDNIYVADSESGSVAPGHGEWKRGIRIGSARDGSLVHSRSGGDRHRHQCSRRRRGRFQGRSVRRGGRPQGVEALRQTLGTEHRL